MLLREVKVRNIRQQEYFLEKMISSMKDNPNCDPQLKYIGYLYPEVIEKLETWGADVIVDNTTPGATVNAIVLADLQREFITRMLLSEPTMDGDPCFTYDGYVPKKTIEYFKKEGFEVVIMNKENAIPKVNFIPDRDVELTEADYFRANEYVREFKEVKHSLAALFDRNEDE